MKRVGAAGLVALMYSVLMPVLAFAKGGGSSLGEPDGPAVLGTGGTLGAGGGGTAFTGAEIAGLVFLAVVLAVAGIAALVMARRRSVIARAEA